VKILQIAYKSDITGGEIVVIDLVKNLLAAGHEVHVASVTQGPLLDVVAQMGAKTTVVPMPKTYSFGAARKIARYIAEQKIDLIQSHGMIPNIMARLAKPLSGKLAVISTEHLALELAAGGRASSFGGRMKSKYYCSLDNLTSRYSDRIICVSEYVKQDKIAQGINPQKLVVIRNGIDLSRFDFLETFSCEAVRAEVGIPAGAPLLGTISRLSPQKDVSSLVGAMPGVWERFPDAHCLIVGDGPLLAEAKQAAAQINQSGRIVFAGYRSDALKLLAAMDIFCLVSLWEGMPLVVMEAMACSLPVICTPVGGTLEIVAENESALVIPFRNPPAIASAALKILSDRELKKSLGQRGRELLDEKGFATTRVAQQVQEIYRQALGVSTSSD